MCLNVELSVPNPCYRLVGIVKVNVRSDGGNLNV